MTSLSRRVGNLFFPRSGRKPLLITIAICLALTAAVTSSFLVLQPVVPLFYSRSQPAQYLTPRHTLLLLPALAWLIYAINTFCVHALHGHLRVMQQIFAWMTCIISALFLVAFLRIVISIW